MALDPTHLNAVEIARQVQSGALGAVEMAKHILARIDRLNPQLRGFTDITATRALQKAAALDAQRARGETLPPLAGVPLAVKNLFDVQGLPTRAGSKIN